MAETNPIELQRALKGASYPTDKQNLTEIARQNGADEQLVEKISQLGEGEFDGPEKVERALFQSK